MSVGRRTAGIIVAGGSGERFGRDGGKQLADVNGLPVLGWSVLALHGTSQVDDLVVVCPGERMEQYRREAIEPLGLSKPVLFAESGPTRQDSVRSGLRVLDESVDVVVVHDGARPLATSALTSRAIALLIDRKVEGVVVGHPSVDTLKIVADSRIVDTPDRSKYWQVQTPQVFARIALERAHALAEAEGFMGTDDSALVERMGGTVLVLEGPRDNLKVTVAEDLAFARAVLDERYMGGNR